MTDLNIKIFQFLNGLAFNDAWLDNMVIFLSMSLGTIVVLFVLLFIFFHKNWHENETTIIQVKTWMKEISILILTALLAWFIAWIFRNVFHTTGSILDKSQINILYENNINDSFPSGFAAFFSAVGLSVYLYHRQVGKVILLCALLMATARVIAGINFPFDVIGGFAIGIGTAYTVDYLIKKRLK